MSEPWHITLLGSLRVQRSDQVITRFRYQKAGGLLAYLAYQLQQAHPREVLIALFWPESELEAGRASLSTVLSSLRNQLEPPGIPANAVLRADRFSISLNPATVTTDVQEFEEAIQQALNTSSQTEKVQSLARAMKRYRGRLLPGFYEEWIAPEQERLAGRFFEAASTLIELLQEQGDLPSALEYARQAVRMDPVREDAQAHLIRLLAAVGQPGAALRQYKELERLLEEELGVEPSAPLRALARQIEKQTGLSAPLLFPSSVVPARPTGSDPTGWSSGMPTTVTLLLTDIASSIQLEERTAEAFHESQETYHHLLGQAMVRHGGQAIRETGSFFMALFPSPHNALACAISVQQALNEQDWPEETGPLRVRMALHTGDVQWQEGTYHGAALHRASRLLTTGQSGQILVSETTASLLGRDMEEPVRLVDLGVWRLRDMPAPEHLYQVEYPGIPAEGFDSPAADVGYQSHLPLRLTRFFGREQEMAQILDLLHVPEHRLLTLTGAGGTGKTRLALEVADRLLERFAGAVWFVGLADLADTGLIASALREAMRLPSSQQEPLEQVMEALNQQPSLVVLDNFEHLVEGGASLVQTLLEQVAGLTLLVTSRQVLGLSGEREFAVGPLPTPNGPDTPDQLSLYDSVRLFVDRAQSVKPDFQVSSNNAPAVAELCDRLEGIPLAIELAAARAQVMTPFQMLSQLSDRFGLLTSRRRDVGERQRTLRGAIDWSYRLLAPELQRFFGRLSVFRGGWTVEAAEAVCEEPLVLDYLALLRECSLVLTDDSGPTMRFRMLETIREYAAEQLTAPERAASQQRHLDFFLALAEETKPKLEGPEQAAWLECLETEHDNLRLALAWCAQAENLADTGLRLSGSLQRFWRTRGHLLEGREWYAVALGREGAQPRTKERALALNGAGILAWMQRDYASARPYHEESLSIRREIGDREGIATSLNGLGNVAIRQGDHALARSLYEESVVIYRAIGNQKDAAGVLGNLGHLARHQGDHALARSLYEESLTIMRERDDWQGIALSLSNLGGLAFNQGDYAAARSRLEEGLAIYRELRDNLGMGICLFYLGALAQEAGDLKHARRLWEECEAIELASGLKGAGSVLGALGQLAADEGDYAEARRRFRRWLTNAQESGNRLDVAAGLDYFAYLAHQLKDRKRCARLYGAGDRLREEIGAPRPPNEQEEYDRRVTEARAALSEEAFAAAWAEGRAMTMEQAIAYALNEQAD